VATYTTPTCQITGIAGTTTGGSGVVVTGAPPGYLYPNQAINITLADNYIAAVPPSGPPPPASSTSAFNPITQAALYLYDPSGNKVYSTTLGSPAGGTASVVPPGGGTYTVVGLVTGVNQVTPAMPANLSSGLPPGTCQATMTINAMCPYTNPFAAPQMAPTPYGNACIGPFALNGGFSSVLGMSFTANDPFGDASITSCPAVPSEQGGKLFNGAGTIDVFGANMFSLGAGLSPGADQFDPLFGANVDIDCNNNPHNGNPAVCFAGVYNDATTAAACTNNTLALLAFGDNCLAFAPPSQVTIGICPFCITLCPLGYTMNGGICCPTTADFCVANDGQTEFMVRVDDYTVGGNPNPSCSTEIVGARDVGCFAPETAIRLAGGKTLPAEKIRQGMWLWNPVRQKPLRVRKVVAGPEKPGLIELGYEGYRIHVTETHPIPTPKGIAKAVNLKAGDLVLGLDGKYHALSVAHRLEAHEGQKVWNFETDVDSVTPEDHLIEAGGMVTGDLNLQVRLEKKLP
jgi:hypothetical protein